ncbi:MAG: glycosyltransferase family 4 protein [Nitrospira sp.]|nr:glycosyltransferase family 4 protein [Nitrospira sp.]MCP9462295.1 glycosyltransferase family 4 protein [Nitrospira sp.]MCP9474878.1 glycosyltransferase family 4 protein [Nitrospira sp.]
MRVLHITAHLGGGVGKVLSGVVAESARRHDDTCHVIACLEAPEKRTFLNRVLSWGGEVLVAPSFDRLAEEVDRADIVQVEWWHHPTVAGWLCSGLLPSMRLLVWCHVSGLYPPVIPPEFVLSVHRFLFTSPCSWEHPALAPLRPRLKGRAAVVFSSGGFDDLPLPPDQVFGTSLRVGYVGSLNFSKLHPRILDFVQAVRLPNFRLVLVGDPVTGEQLVVEAAKMGARNRLEVRGYREDVRAELIGFDVFAYLLNPFHYGTTENALLEAMAMGVVPVVLDNPAERHLVSDRKTGVVVRNPSQFADALDWLAAHPFERAKLSADASRLVRRRFTIGRTVAGLKHHYRQLLTEPKRSFDFRPIFGEEPADWFRSCQGDEAWRFQRGNVQHKASGRGPAILYERTKSSIFHYHAVYPQDERLTQWARQLEAA